MHQHPLFADKVGFEVGNGQVVGGIDAVGFEDRGEHHAASVARGDGHADDQFRGLLPSLFGHPPGVIIAGLLGISCYACLFVLKNFEIPF